MSPSIDAIVPRTPASGASTGSPDGERRRRRQRAQGAQRLLGAPAALGGRAEAAVAIALGLAGFVKRRSPLALAAAGGADLLAQRLELGPRLGEVALGLEQRGLARRRGRGAHLLVSASSSRLALARARGERLRLEPLALGRVARLGRAPLGLLGLGQQRRRAEPLPGRCACARPRPRPRRSPSRAAICSACDVPGRPTAIR